VDFRLIREWVLPWEAERGEGFQQEALSLSHRGLGIVGGAEIIGGLLALAGFERWQPGAGLLAVGVATVLAARSGRLYPWSRAVSAISAGIGAALAAAHIGPGVPEDFALAITTLMVLTSAAVPLLPIQSLAVGAAAAAGGFGTNHRIFLMMIAAAGAAITAAIYYQRRDNHRAFVGALRASQDVRALQTRLQRAESSAAMVRLSAALAHELSAPIAAVSSTVETLLLLTSRRAEAPASDQQRLAGLQADLGRSVEEPLSRLKKIINRLQRLTDLDEAVLQRANLNDLIREAAGLVKQQANSAVQFNLELEPLPDLSCRPQQLIAVLCNVLTNSVESLEGKGRISVYSRASESWVEVRIEDNGRGIPHERLAQIFDPAFQVAEGRVSIVNWTLFTSRQFIKDHGGEMRIHSREGSGTTVSFTLPCSS
jgi:signal transduction histidine kinase